MPPRRFARLQSEHVHDETCFGASVAGAGNRTGLAFVLPVARSCSYLGAHVLFAVGVGEGKRRCPLPGARVALAGAALCGPTVA